MKKSLVYSRCHPFAQDLKNDAYWLQCRSISKSSKLNYKRGKVGCYVGTQWWCDLHLKAIDRMGRSCDVGWIKALHGFSSSFCSLHSCCHLRSSCTPACCRTFSRKNYASTHLTYGSGGAACNYMLSQNNQAQQTGKTQEWQPFGRPSKIHFALFKVNKMNRCSCEQSIP